MGPQLGKPPTWFRRDGATINTAVVQAKGLAGLLAAEEEDERGDDEERGGENSKVEGPGEGGVDGVGAGAALGHVDDAAGQAQDSCGQRKDVCDPPPRNES